MKKPAETTAPAAAGDHEAKCAQLPQKLRDAAKQLLAAGMDWQTVLALLVQYGPQVIDVIQKILDQFRQQPVKAAAGRSCPEVIARQRESLLCALCCNLHMEHEHAPAPQPA